MLDKLWMIINALGNFTPYALIGSFIGSMVTLILYKLIKPSDKITSFLLVCAIFSGSFLLAYPINGYIQKSARINNIKMLTPEEQSIMKNYIEKNSITFSTQFPSGITISLEKKQMIYKAFETSHDVVFNISPQYFELLKERPDLIGLPQKTPP